MDSATRPTLLEQYRHFEEVSVENLSEFAHLPLEAQMTAKLNGMIQDGKGIRYDVFDLPNLTPEVRAAISRGRYRHLVDGDVNVLVPPDTL